jgi:hypothetical protein
MGSWGHGETAAVFEEFFGAPAEAGEGWARWVCHPDGVRMSVTLKDRSGACVAALEGPWAAMGDLAHCAFLEVRTGWQAVWLVRRLLESVPRGMLRGAGRF